MPGIRRSIQKHPLKGCESGTSAFPRIETWLELREDAVNGRLEDGDAQSRNARVSAAILALLLDLDLRCQGYISSSVSARVIAACLISCTA